MKIRYELDPHNRLVLPKFRTVLDGRFRTDENNDLSYHIKSPLSESEKIPHQIKLSGEWSLTDDHELRLTLDKLGRETFGDAITLRGEILDVEKNSLLFAVTTITKQNTQSTYVLTLAGSWKADENNRLSFRVRKEGGRYDILTLTGTWQIDKNYEIIYRYEKAALIRKKKEAHTLTLKGCWDIRDKARLSYILSGGTDSAFEFKTSVGIFSEKYIRYEIGIGVAGRAEPAMQTVTIYGKWNLKKDVGLIFEVEYADKKTRAIIFGAEAKLTKNDTVSFTLKDDIENKDIGAKVELSHRILNGDGEAFLRLLKSKREAAIYAGAAWRW